MKLQKAIDLLEGLLQMDFIEYECDNQEKKAIKMGIRALKKQRTNRWISVKDRLPKEDGKYLTYTVFPTDTICSDLFFKDGIWYVDNDCYDLVIGEVTHWMPLIEPK